MNLRLIVYAIGALALLWLGWKVNGWRLEAARAAQLETQLATEVKNRKAADDARILALAQLREMDQAIAVEVREVVKRVPVYIDRDNCSLGVDGVRAINQARGVPVPGG